MADGIFTEDELKAEQQGPAVEATPEQQQEAADQQGQPRGPDGKFASKEPEPEPVVEPEADKEKGGTVPQQALHAEREKRKALEAELKPLKEQLEALAKMRGQIASRKPADLPPADDPAQVEHLRARLAELEQGQTRISQHIDTQAVNQAEMQQLGSVMHQSETKFREQKPDYDAAINHVVQARAQELSLYGLTPPQIQQTIAEEATEIVRSAISQNRDPAELGYQIALSRGYRPGVNGIATGTAEDEASKQPLSKAQQTIDAIAKAQQQSKSLGGAGGGKVQTLNAEAVLAMSPEEFDRVYSTPEGKAMIDSL